MARNKQNGMDMFGNDIDDVAASQGAAVMTHRTHARPQRRNNSKRPQATFIWQNVSHKVQDGLLV